jgi:ABC-type branched-subunit amino acid transport system ATPase component
MSDALLSVSGLTAGYGATEVLRGIDLEVAEGEIVERSGEVNAQPHDLRRAARNAWLHPLRWRRDRA